MYAIRSYYVVTDLFNSIPSGVGSKGSVKLNHSQLDEVLTRGVNWAIDNGYGSSHDAEVCEENGQIVITSYSIHYTKLYEIGRTLSV